MQQDWVNAIRDNIILYMLIAPILLAIGARVVLPSVNQAQYTFAVQAGLESGVIDKIDSIANIEFFPDQISVKERVLRSDDVPGVILQDNQLELIMEGNEGGEADILRSVFEQVLVGDPVSSITFTRSEGMRSLVKEYTAMLFIMVGSLLGALVMAFNIIEDKESNALRALGVSPLSMLELTLARGLFALILSLAIILAATLIIMGTTINYGLMLIGFLFSIGLPILTGYAIGGFADSQLKAIAILKFYMLIYLTIPAVSIFVPRSWHWLFYGLPNYWMWHTFENVFIGNLGGPGFWWSGIITIGLSFIFLGIAFPILRRQMKLR